MTVVSVRLIDAGSFGNYKEKKQMRRLFSQHSSGLMRSVPFVETSLALKLRQPALSNVRSCLWPPEGRPRDTNLAFPQFAAPEPILNYCVSKNVNFV